MEFPTSKRIEDWTEADWDDFFKYIEDVNVLKQPGVNVNKYKQYCELVRTLIPEFKGKIKFRVDSADEKLPTHGITLFDIPVLRGKAKQTVADALKQSDGLGIFRGEGKPNIVFYVDDIWVEMAD